MRFVLALILASCGRIHFDPGCTTGSGDDDGGDGDAFVLPPNTNIMFVTSTLVDFVALRSLADADAECRARASAAGLPGTYIAWLSTSTAAAGSRLTGDGWIRPDGKPFARTRAELLAGYTLYVPTLNEYAQDVGKTSPATATRSDGTFDSSGDSCGALTGSGTITIGDSMSGGAFWTDIGDTVPCTSNPIFCFSTDYTNPLVTTPPAVQRLAFVSSQAFTMGGGIASADAYCQNEAAAAGFPGTFLALVAMSTASAASRYDLTGPPWYRVDGIPIVRVASDLASSSLIAPLDLDSTGTLQGGVSLVSTGSHSLASVADENCSDWMASTGSDYQTTGGPFYADKRYIGAGRAQCTGYTRLYCLQQ